jgi:hypothetical protein
MKIAAMVISRLIRKTVPRMRNWVSISSWPINGKPFRRRSASGAALVTAASGESLPRRSKFGKVKGSLKAMECPFRNAQRAISR